MQNKRERQRLDAKKASQNLKKNTSVGSGSGNTSVGSGSSSSSSSSSANTKGKLIHVSREGSEGKGEGKSEMKTITTKGGGGGGGGGGGDGKSEGNPRKKTSASSSSSSSSNGNSKAAKESAEKKIVSEAIARAIEKADILKNAPPPLERAEKFTNLELFGINQEEDDNFATIIQRYADAPPKTKTLAKDHPINPKYAISLMKYHHDLSATSQKQRNMLKLLKGDIIGDARAEIKSEEKNERVFGDGSKLRMIERKSAPKLTLDTLTASLCIQLVKQEIASSVEDAFDLALKLMTGTLDDVPRDIKLDFVLERPDHSKSKKPKSLKRLPHDQQLTRILEGIRKISESKKLQRQQKKRKVRQQVEKLHNDDSDDEELDEEDDDDDEGDEEMQEG